MNTLPVTTPAPESLERVCAFTLATALAWVGHDCTGDCPPTAATMQASVWFIRRAVHITTDRATTLVVVDLGDSASEPAPVRTMLGQVNACTRPDRIRVRERVSVEHGHAVAALADPNSSTGAVLYLRSDASARLIGALGAPPPAAPRAPAPEQLRREHARSRISA